MPTGIYTRTLKGEQRRITALQSRFENDPALGQRVAGYLKPDAVRRGQKLGLDAIRKRMSHSLSEIDIEKLTAVCKSCGLAPLQSAPGTQFGFVCCNKRNRIVVEFPGQLQQVWEQQEHKCAICRQDTRPFLDHCHASGRFRGFLCRSCNLALGLFLDSVESLKTAVAYLEANRVS